MKQLLPGLTSASRVFPQTGSPFPRARPASSMGPRSRRSPKLRVDLYIDPGATECNRACFDVPVAERGSIEAEMGAELSWGRLDDRRASRVAAYRSGSITDPPEKLAELRDWAVDVLSRFVKVFGPRVAVL